MLREQCVCMALLSCCVSFYCFCLHQLHGSGVGLLVGLCWILFVHIEFVIITSKYDMIVLSHTTTYHCAVHIHGWTPMNVTSLLLNFKQSQLIHCSLRILLFYNNTWHDTIIIKYSMQNNNENYVVLLNNFLLQISGILSAVSLTLLT